MTKGALLCLVAVLWSAVAHADILLFYAGDTNGQNAIANENDALVGGNPYGAAVYQNFTTTQSFTVTKLFTNNFSSLTPSMGYWEIRQGVSVGNGGTLVASGNSTGGNWSWTPTGRSGFGYTEYTGGCGGAGVNLAAGTYWFACVPSAPQQNGRSLNSATSGLNRYAYDGTTTQDGLQYFNSPFYGDNFIALGAGFPAGSGGVYVVPEPSSMIMFSSGLLAAAGVLRRRLL